MKEMITIGSIVSLYNIHRKLMIIGYCQKEVETEKIWDYVACFYPEGFVSAKRLVLFDKEQIETVYLRGYLDQEAFDFQTRLEKNIQKGREENE